MNRRPLVRSFLASAALVVAVALAGCQTDGTTQVPAKAMKPLSDRMVSEIEQKNMDKESPILVRVFKQESELEVWKQDRSGKFALLKTYPICRWSGELGPKIKEGDRQAPEGFYSITPGQMNPHSQFYLAFDLGYPNAYDRSHGRTGAHLMVHGDCSSRGCYSMTDEQITEIYALGREAFFGGQRSFQVQAYPFRMTPQNMAKHRSNPHFAFWKMLKQGYDHFEVTRMEPKIDVCERRYVFNAQDPSDPYRPLPFSAAGRCPVYEVPQEIAAAVAEKEQRDNVQFAQLVRRGAPLAPVRTNADGGMHPVFAEAVKRNELGTPKQSMFSLASVPGTIPNTVRPPRTAEFANINGEVAQPTPAGEPAQVASAEAQQQQPQQQQQQQQGGNLFGSLFRSGSQAGGNVLNRMGQMVGLRGTAEPQPAAAAAPVPAPKPRPAARPVETASRGAIRPAQAEPQTQAAPQPARTAAAQPPRPPEPQAQPSAPALAAAPAPAPAAPGLMTGAAPTVQAGSFENRWSGFR